MLVPRLDSSRRKWNRAAKCKGLKREGGQEGGREGRREGGKKGGEQSLEQPVGVSEHHRRLPLPRSGWSR